MCLAGGQGAQGRVRGRVGVAGSRKRELRDGVKEGGSQASSNHFGTLGRRGCPGGTKGLGAPCQSQTPARPGWYGKGVSSCSPVLSPPSNPQPSRVLL